MATQQLYTFLPGRPAAQCRPFTDAELQQMREATLASVTTITGPQRDGYTGPHAVFVAGLPGAGKSTLTPLLLASGWVPPGEYVTIDADVLRQCHAQFREQSLRPHRYEEEMAWFMEGSGFEDAVFRRKDGLMGTLFDARRSFVQVSLVNTHESLRWVQHVVRRGYRVHHCIIHATGEDAAARVAKRAATTGRYCSRERVLAVEPGLLRWSRQVARAALDSGGDVCVLDNTAAAEHAALFGRSVDHHALLARYGAEASLLSRPNIVRFATEMMSRLPPGLLSGVTAHLAGGAFKCLLQPPVASNRPSLPRDLDVWPATPADEALLLARLSQSSSSCVPGRWNHRFSVPSANGDGELVVEIVRPTPGRSGALDVTLAYFDIALSAIGVTFDNGTVAGCSVHPLALDSVEQRVPLLLPGLPNVSFLLSTAERLLRYATELGWSRPDAQIEELRRVFVNADPARRRELIRNWARTTLSYSWKAEVMSSFQISDVEVTEAAAAV